MVRHYKIAQAREMKPAGARASGVIRESGLGWIITNLNRK